MRRQTIVEKPVGAAIWCRRVAVLGLLLAGAAVVASRRDLVDPPAAMAVLVAALGCAGFAVLLALASAVVVWRTGRPGLGAALGGIVVACLLVTYPAYLARKAYRVPASSDVTTDPADPVAFAQSPKALAARHGVTHDLPSEADRRAQAAVYPDVRPLTLDDVPADVYRAALKLARARRWVLVDAQAPAGRPTTGRIEAVARTPVMGFPDDIALRIAALGTGQTRVDARSASRFGRRDAGANAARLEAFLSDLEDAADGE